MEMVTVAVAVAAIAVVEAVAAAATTTTVAELEEMATLLDPVRRRYGNPISRPPMVHFIAPDNNYSSSRHSQGRILQRINTR